MFSVTVVIEMEQEDGQVGDSAFDEGGGLGGLKEPKKSDRVGGSVDKRAISSGMSG